MKIANNINFRFDLLQQLPIGYFNVRNVAKSNVIFEKLVPFTDAAKLYVMSYNNITATNDDDVVFLLQSQQHQQRHICMLFPSKSFNLGLKDNKLYFAIGDIFDRYVMYFQSDRQSEDVFNKIKKYARSIVATVPELDEDNEIHTSGISNPDTNSSK